jgi:hypothetical protein
LPGSSDKNYSSRFSSSYGTMSISAAQFAVM